MHLFYSYPREAFKFAENAEEGDILVVENIPDATFLPLSDDLNKVMSEFKGVDNIVEAGFYFIS